MRFLITGSAGFIGSHLADRLIERGHTVIGVDNFLTGRHDNFPATLEFDITDRANFYDVANEFAPDIVVHCAASYSDPNLWHRDTDTNVAGTINAALVARHHSARLVYFQTALPPISSYAISKIAGEQYINLSGVPALIFRLSNIYGPRNVSGPIPTFYKRLSEGAACTVVDTKRDMVYIDDLIDLVTRGIDREATGKYDVCSGIARPILDLFNAVVEHFPDVTGGPLQVAAPIDDVKQMQLDPFRATDDLHWNAATPLSQGVSAAVAWYRDHGVGQTYTHLALKG